jgi:hypothetical protein
MTDYQPLLKRALSGLESNTLEGRRSIYERARHALVNQLRTVTPPLAEADITRERLALEEAIRRVEAQAAAAAAPAPVAAVAPRAPVATPVHAQPHAPIPPITAWPASAQPRIQPTPQPQIPVPQPQVQVQPPAPVTPQPQAPVFSPQPQVQVQPSAQVAPQSQPQAPIAPQPYGQPQAPVQQVPPQIPVPQPQGQPPSPPRRGPIAAPAAATQIATRPVPMPRAPSGLRPAPPQARAPMPAGMESARRPVASEPWVPVSGVDLDSAPAEFEDFRPAPPQAAPQPAAVRAPRPRNAEVARADRRKAIRARLVVNSIVLILLAAAAVLGYAQRERILAFLHVGPPVAEADRPKAADRVASDPNPAARPAQPVPATSITAVAQRAVLYEENSSASPQQQQQLFVGSAVWRTETITVGPGRPPEIGIRVDIEIPDRRVNVVMTIRRNPDATMPASHTVEIQFATPGDAFGGVANMPGIRAKGSEAAQGAPLAGLVVRVTPGFFLIGLSNIAADRDRNMSLLRERPWMDIPFVYNNGRRAVIAIEKGTPGERVVNEALAAWDR